MNEHPNRHHNGIRWPHVAAALTVCIILVSFGVAWGSMFSRQSIQEDRQSNMVRVYAELARDIGSMKETIARIQVALEVLARDRDRERAPTLGPR